MGLVQFKRRLRALPQAAPAAPAAAPAASANGQPAGFGARTLLPFLFDGQAGPHDVLECLRAQPVLAARVLKVANLAFYRCAGSVDSLERALSMLGLAAVRGIAAAACLDRPLPGAVASRVGRGAR